MNNKKISKKQAEKVLEERDPYVGIVLEEINGNLKTLLNGHEVIQKRIDRLDGRMGKVEVGLEKLDVDVHSLTFDIRKKADKEEVVALGHQITQLESN